MDQSELHDLLKFVLYGSYITATAQATHSTDLDIIWSTLEFIQFRHPVRNTSVYIFPTTETIFSM